MLSFLSQISSFFFYFIIINSRMPASSLDVCLLELTCSSCTLSYLSITIHKVIDLKTSVSTMRQIMAEKGEMTRSSAVLKD
uniref:Uncharacterized protein n=1 Tax=Octopus bimaculoides TaxID=37653 RepID=A0A0L8HVV1_OCTBM